MRKFLVRLLDLLRTHITVAESAPVPHVEPREPAPVVLRPPRPLSPTVSKVLDLVNAKPDITATEVAAVLKLSPSYARTVLRRARSASETARCSTAVPDTALLDLQRRLNSAEKDLAAVRSLPVHVRASLNLNRRAEVLRLLGGGLPPESVAEKLAIPQGEVDFIRKVDRMLPSSV